MRGSRPVAKPKPRKYHFHTAMRKNITACLLRAIARHEKVRREIGQTMPWPDYKRLMDWQHDWEDYLRQQRAKLYDGQHTDRGQETAQGDPDARDAIQSDARG